MRVAVTRQLGAVSVLAGTASVESNVVPLRPRTRPQAPEAPTHAGRDAMSVSIPTWEQVRQTWWEVGDARAAALAVAALTTLEGLRGDELVRELAALRLWLESRVR